MTQSNNGIIVLDTKSNRVKYRIRAIVYGLNEQVIWYQTKHSKAKSETTNDSTTR